MREEIEFNISDTDRETLRYHDKCDKYDYIIAAACGALSGLIDIFFVGSALDVTGMSFTDKQVDNAVMAVAKKCGWTPQGKNTGNPIAAIDFLEKRFSVNYDRHLSSMVGGAVDLTPSNHHFKSLGHSPDILGLFFSVLNQFTSTATFIDRGKIVTVSTETFELKGTNFVSKLACGILNWIMHMISDVAGSAPSRRHGGRGVGITLPFYELFGLCNFGQFNVNGSKKTLAELAETLFNEGYDFRFGLKASIPVFLCNLLIRFIWAIRHRFQYKKPWRECFPSKKHDDLRVMLLVGNGTLCTLDAGDALLRSGGNLVNFLSRLNLIAWFNLLRLALREVCIRAGLSMPLERELNAFKRVNEALTLYLNQLKQIDIEQYKKETQKYNEITAFLDRADSAERLNAALRDALPKLGIDAPWGDKKDFEDFMRDSGAVLKFE